MEVHASSFCDEPYEPRQAGKLLGAALPKPEPKLLGWRGAPASWSFSSVAIVSVLVAELGEHSSDGVGLGGDLDPFHGAPAACTGTDVDLPHMTQQPRTGSSFAGALPRVAVVEPEHKLVRVDVEWILDCRRRFWHNFSAQ